MEDFTTANRVDTYSQKRTSVKLDKSYEVDDHIYVSSKGPHSPNKSEKSYAFTEKSIRNEVVFYEPKISQKDAALKI